MMQKNILKKLKQMSNPKTDKADKKAKELFEKFMSHAYGDTKPIREFNARQSCLICVNEILQAGPGDIDDGEDLISGMTHWNRVKESIKKL